LTELLSRKAITKVQSSILVAVIIIAVVAGGAAYYYTTIPPEKLVTPTKSEPLKLTEPVKVTVVSAEPPVASYTRIAAFVEILRKEFPKGSTFGHELITGYASNTKYIGEKKADLGIIACRVVVQGSVGELPGQTAPYTNLRTIATGFEPAIIHWVVHKDFPANTLEELIAKKIPIKLGIPTKGTEGELVFNEVLTVYGITIKDIESWGGKVIYLAFKDFPGYLKDRLMDSWFCVQSLGDPGFYEASMACDLKWLPLSQKAIDYFTKPPYKYYSAYSKYTLKKDHWRLAPEYPSFAANVAMVTRADVSDAIVYNILEAFSKNKDDFFINWPSAKPFFKFEDAWKDTPVPLHPGAEQWFKVRGYMK